MPLLVLTNATSHQSLSIISAIQSDPSLNTDYQIRGLTRDPSQPKCQSLIKNTGISLVQADISDPPSLRSAFQHADIVFATTITVYDAECRTFEHEVAHGKALADAAVAMAVPCIIYSTLPSIREISGGALTAGGHFDGKKVVEDYIRSLPIRSAFVSPGSFMENFKSALAPRWVSSSSSRTDTAATGEEGENVLACFVRPDTQIPLIYVQEDFGKWIAAMVADFDRFEGRAVCAATRMYSFQEIVETMSRVSGKRVVYRHLGKEAWGSFLPPERRPYLLDMMQCFQDFGYFGEGTAEKVGLGREKIRGEVTELEEYLRRNPLVLH